MVAVLMREGMVMNRVTLLPFVVAKVVLVVVVVLGVCIPLLGSCEQQAVAASHHPPTL
jgi:cellobiose-specific phosphotransferase system component IIC